MTEGSIAIDGVDVRHIRLDDLRRAIGVVQQDVFLFADTIRENIRYGRPDASDAEVEAAEGQISAVLQRLTNRPRSERTIRNNVKLKQ